jgi:hypothetical protein
MYSSSFGTFGSRARTEHRWSGTCSRGALAQGLRAMRCPSWPEVVSRRVISDYSQDMSSPVACSPKTEPPAVSLAAASIFLRGRGINRATAPPLWAVGELVARRRRTIVAQGTGLVASTSCHQTRLCGLDALGRQPRV